MDGVILYEDTLQQTHSGDKHAIKHEWWNAHGIIVVRVRVDGKHLPVPVTFGDYYREGANIVVDTKRNVAEIAANIGGKDHQRFREECRRAKRDGYRLIILVENSEGISDLGSLTKWTNTHCIKCSIRNRRGCKPQDNAGKCPRHNTRKPIQGERLAKAMATMSEKYGVRFEFCNPNDSAKIICDLLGVKYEQNATGGA